MVERGFHRFPGLAYFPVGARLRGYNTMVEGLRERSGFDSLTVQEILFFWPYAVAPSRAASFCSFTC